jgi:hypothetical protein
MHCHFLLPSSIPTRNYLACIPTESKCSPFIGLYVNNLNWRMIVLDYDRSKNQMLLREMFFSLQLWIPPLMNVKGTISLPKCIYFLFSILGEFSLRPKYTNPRADNHRLVRVFCCQPCSEDYLLWVYLKISSLLSNGYRGHFLRCVKLPTHFQLEPGSRKHGTIYPLPHTPSWRSD